MEDDRDQRFVQSSSEGKWWPFMQHDFWLQTPRVFQSFPMHTFYGMKGQQPWGWGRQPENFSLDVFPAMCGIFHWGGFPMIAKWLPQPKSVSRDDIGWTWKPISKCLCGLSETSRAHHVLSTPPDPYLLQMFHDGCQDFPPAIWTMSQMTNWQTMFPEPWCTTVLLWWKTARACKVLTVMGPCCLWPHIQSSQFWVLLKCRHWIWINFDQWATAIVVSKHE